MQPIEFMYDFGSPNAYLVHKILPGLAAKYHADLHYVPILLGGVFKATNHHSPMQAFAEVRNKLAYQARETERFVAHHNITYRFNPHFPVMTIAIMRGAIFAQGKPWEMKYIDTIFDAMWVKEKKMDDAEVIADVLTNAGLPATDIIQATQNPEIKGRLIASTSSAVERGAFGAPTMFVGDEMFFGKDSLPDLERFLSAAPS